jgi:hypothetical protein
MKTKHPHDSISHYAIDLSYVQLNLKTDAWVSIVPLLVPPSLQLRIGTIWKDTSEFSFDLPNDEAEITSSSICAKALKIGRP